MKITALRERSVAPQVAIRKFRELAEAEVEKLVAAGEDAELIDHMRRVYSENANMLERLALNPARPRAREN